MRTSPLFFGIGSPEPPWRNAERLFAGPAKPSRPHHRAKANRNRAMKFACPHCQQELDADDSLAGTTVDCPVCGQAIFIEAPPPPETPPPPPSEPDIPTPAQEAAPMPEPPPPQLPLETPPPPPPQPRAQPKFRVVSRPADKSKSHSQPKSKAKSTSPIDLEDKVRKSVGNLHEKFNDFTGLEKLEGFSLQALFSDIFGKHKAEDIEDFFTVGTPRATPPIEEVDTSWPRPWIFFRALAASILLYMILSGGFQYFKNPNLIPGMMVMGTLAVPFSALLFFYEVNVRQNVSLYQVLRLFFLGGILSLIISLVFFAWAGDIVTGSWEASMAGPIEESGKLLALILVARSPRYHYKLNGLLMGAAIGTGFAVFESMGYAFNNLHDGFAYVARGVHVNPIQMMTDNIFNRGVLSPFGHIVWTAIAGAALWRAKGAQPFRMSMLLNGKFWHLFLIPVILHVLWNSPLLLNIPYHGRFLLLGFVAWFVVIALVQEGLKELRAEKLAAMGAEAKEQEQSE